METIVQLFNTMTRKKEELQTLEPGKVRLYTCGPTVYMYVTIGNLRSFVCEDLLRRYLEYRGYEVAHVMNITDVGHLTEDEEDGEDKLEVTARKQKKDPWQIAEFYASTFFEDIDAIGIKRATWYPKATEFIPEMIALVQRLIDNGHAYVSNDNVYYDISSFPPYGRLSGNPIEELMPGARLAVNPDKRDPRDFALWVTDPKHIMRWESPWGVGYPYWHVECSAMAMKLLGDSIDIHCGGEDNIFPHHECEIAQSEGATGQPYVRSWMHIRFLLVDGKKMSKSLGNFYTLRDLLDKGYDAGAIRYLLLSTHYRQPLNFTLDGIDAAKEGINRLSDFRLRMQEGAAGAAPEDPDVAAAIEKGRAGFEAAMDDDLNISPALAALFNMVSDINRLDAGPVGAACALDLLARINEVLNVLPKDEALGDAEIERLIEERQQARKDKDFARADAIRDQLKDMGIIIEDTSHGLRWKRA